MSVSPGMPLFEVADLSTVWVVAEVYESDLKRVRVGQTARFEAAAYPGETFTGKVKFVYPTLDAQIAHPARAARVPQPARAGGAEAAPGHVRRRAAGSARHRRADGAQPRRWWTPGTMQYVFVAKPGGRFEPRRVEAGRPPGRPGGDRRGGEPRARRWSPPPTSSSTPRAACAPPSRASGARRGRRRRTRHIGTDMVEKIIEFCARNRLVVMLGVGFALLGAFASIRRMKLDAIPDLSDPQVIVFTEWMGRSPTLVEDQVTYPIAAKLIGTPRGVRRARLLDVRDVVHLRRLRGGHGHLLGAQPGAGVPERPARPACPRG